MEVSKAFFGTKCLNIFASGCSCAPCVFDMLSYKHMEICSAQETLIVRSPLDVSPLLAHPVFEWCPLEYIYYEICPNLFIRGKAKNSTFDNKQFMHSSR